MIKWLAYIINIVCIKKTIPDDWWRGIILPVWKNKENKRVCSNHCGLSLLSIPLKLFAIILWSVSDQHSTTTAAVNKLASLPDEVQSNTFSQFDKSSTNRRNLINNSTYIAFIDFKAALTQCPVIPWRSTGTFCSCASIVHRHPQRVAPRFLSVRRVHHRDWREARVCHCNIPLRLYNRPPHESPAASL